MNFKHLADLAGIVAVGVACAVMWFFIVYGFMCYFYGH